jgi:two-component system, NtrC family, sensor histidine kinase GlrK
LINLFSLKLLVVMVLAAAIAPAYLTAKHAVSALRENSAMSETRVHQIVGQVKAARSIVERTAEFERKARLLVVLSDPTLSRPYERESYESAHASFRRALDDFLSTSIEQERVALINRLSDRERLIYDQLSLASRGSDLKPPDDSSFQALRIAANDLWREVVEDINREGTEFSAHAQDIERRIWNQAAQSTVIPVVAVLALLGFSISPMRQLHGAIRRLAAGHTSQPIAVGRPQEFRSLGTQLERLRQHLVTRSQSSAQLILSLRREIGGPLSTVCEDLRRLAEEYPADPSPQQLALAEDLNRNALQLQGLLNELLRYDALSKGAGESPKTSVNMENLIETVLQEQQRNIESKSMIINASLAPVEVLADAAQMRAMIESLLGNAIRYSPMDSEVRIILRATGPLMKLEIEDDGAGIDDEERMHVFEPFFRGKAARASDDAGLGLGLAIASACIANHRGKIEIVDPRHPKRGARIRVQLPLNPEAADAA